MIDLKINYEEPCTCGCLKIQVENVWRIVTWKCAECGKTLASTTLSDSPVAHFYAQKHLIAMCNTKLRKEKGLCPKKTIVTFYNDNGDRIYWKDIVSKNKAWEKSVGCIQRKPF